MQAVYLTSKHINILFLHRPLSITSTHVRPYGIVDACSTRFLKDGRLPANGFIGAFAVTPGKGELAAALTSIARLRAVPTSAKSIELSHLSVWHGRLLNIRTTYLDADETTIHAHTCVSIPRRRWG